MAKASGSVRLFFVMLASVNLIGIGLSGFNVVHWFAYALPVFLIIAAITGLCPGLLVSKKILSLFGIEEAA